MKLCRFSGIFGKFTNITNTECGSDGTNNIFDHPYCLKKTVIWYTSLEENTKLSIFLFF